MQEAGLIKHRKHALAQLSSSDKTEIVEPQIFFGAGDFSPPNAYVFGTSVFGFAYAVTGKSRAPTDMHPANSRFIEQKNALRRGGCKACIMYWKWTPQSVVRMPRGVSRAVKRE